MKLLKICFLLLALTPVVFSQNIDSLFHEYLRFRGAVKDPDYTAITTASNQTGKCGFGLAHQLMQNFGELSLDKQHQLEILLSRPERDTSIVSPDGIFRIHYNLKGPQSPGYDVNELAVAFDSSYNYMINILGYPPHLSDVDTDGEDKYDVYIENLGSGSYGETVLETQHPGGFYSTYMRIDNDFKEGEYFPPSIGINGAMVTAAHEYHHAIQVSNYGFFSNERYFYELTSTSMEEFVFDDINDYVYWIPPYFRQTYRAFVGWGSGGATLVLWNLYLREKFANEGEPDKGFDIIKRSWEILANQKVALPSISQALFENGTSFKQEFSNYGIWCYFTGHRADPVKYFEEGHLYPEVTPLVKYDYYPPKKSYEVSSQPVSNNYLLFDLVDSEFRDTLVSIITNHDIEFGASEPFINTEYTYTLSTENGSRHIINEYYSTIESNRFHVLYESNIFNNTEVSGGTVEREQLDYAFPQPFRYSTNDYIYIPVNNNELGFADLNIYTSAMDLVYEGRKNIIAADKIVVLWDVRDSNGNKLPTGVYIYATSSDDSIVKGKLIIYND